MDSHVEALHRRTSFASRLLPTTSGAKARGFKDLGYCTAPTKPEHDINEHKDPRVFVTKLVVAQCCPVTHPAL